MQAISATPWGELSGDQTAPLEQVEEKIVEDVAISTQKKECSVCPKPCVPGRKMCQEHLEHNRQRSIAIRELRKSRESCYWCSAPRVPGLKICAKHRKTKRERQNIRAARKKKEGICLSCTKKSIPGRQHCPEHFKGKQERLSKRYNELKANNSCVRCGQPKSPKDTRVQCEKCLRYAREAQAAKRKRAKVKAGTENSGVEDDYMSIAEDSDGRIQVSSLSINDKSNDEEMSTIPLQASSAAETATHHNDNDQICN
ncbi:hypothetical protein M434DRAFT_35387 [Hypoxylon sp. CO27-5]|nr:hypothetical protein M434DRAFT_35387 [Hypoxylon sp. CO27-5]